MFEPGGRGVNVPVNVVWGMTDRARFTWRQLGEEFSPPGTPPAVSSVTTANRIRRPAGAAASALPSSRRCGQRPGVRGEGPHRRSYASNAGRYRFCVPTAESDTGTPRIAADLRTITARSREERFVRTTADAGAVGLPSRLGA